MPPEASKGGGELLEGVLLPQVSSGDEVWVVASGRNTSDAMGRHEVTITNLRHGEGRQEIKTGSSRIRRR